MVDGTNRSFRNNIKSKFSPQIIKENNSNKGKNLVNTLYISLLPSPIPVKTAKEINKISKYFLKNLQNTTKKSYTQASANPTNISNIARNTLKIKEAFLKLQDKKIKIVQKIINRQDKLKPKLNMMTKGPSHKQVIISMNNNSTIGFIKDSSTHVININRILKNIKSSTMADFICINSKSIIITTNNIASLSDLQAIEQYVKSIVSIEPNQVQSPKLPQSKSYLKIIRVPYLAEATNICISFDNIEKILKNNHLFNNIVLASKPRIIKVSPKSDIFIIWIDIWDSQSRFKAKSLINRRFNVRSFITTIQEANMNSKVPQCKNCWK